MTMSPLLIEGRVEGLGFDENVYQAPQVEIVSSLGILRIARGECNCGASDDNPY